MSESLRNDGRIWVPKAKGESRPPGDIPDVGRIAVIADPQGAPVALITPMDGRS